MTGEAWNGVMHDMMVADCDPAFNPLEPDDKDYDERYCGAPHENAWLFFVLFNVVVTGLLFELITAIVLDEFNRMSENAALPVNSDMIEEVHVILASAAAAAVVALAGEGGALVQMLFLSLGGGGACDAGRSLLQQGFFCPKSTLTTYFFCFYFFGVAPLPVRWRGWVGFWVHTRASPVQRPLGV